MNKELPKHNVIKGITFCLVEENNIVCYGSGSYGFDHWKVYIPKKEIEKGTIKINFNQVIEGIKVRNSVFGPSWFKLKIYPIKESEYELSKIKSKGGIYGYGNTS